MERSPEEVHLYEGSVFISITIKGKKYLLFHNSNNVLTELDCTCPNSWRKKSKGDTSLVCMHELIYYLSKYIFHLKAKEKVGELNELLYKNK